MKLNILSVKKAITNSINHNFGKIRIDSYKKILTLHNVVILIKLVG